MSSDGSITLRRARHEDADLVREIVRGAYARWVPVIGREPMPMRVDYAKAIQKHGIDLLLLEGDPAGLIETKLESDHLWIENVAVRPEKQGRGLGRRLLAWAEELAAEAALTELRLLTNEAFADNVSLYQRLDYRIDRREPFMGGITLYMSKRV
jgi:GNAT superfamily N-acetyltransferase